MRKYDKVTGLPLIGLEDWWQMVNHVRKLEMRVKVLENE